MIWYHLIFSDNKKAVGYAWNLMGFVAKLAQGVSYISFCPVIIADTLTLLAWSAYVMELFVHRIRL